DAAWWRERFADSSRPLRVLIPTSRYSTFVQHSSRDIARGLEALGHRAEVLIEPDGSSCLASGAYLDAILSLEPDLVICINYPRVSIGDFLPRNLPWVCWIQDQMPHLFDERLGRSLGVLDFTVGHLVAELHTKYAYPVRSSRNLPVPASEHKFAPRAASPSEVERFACDIAYVSHQSETPDAQHERLVGELRSNSSVDGSLLRAMPLLREAIERHVQRPLSTLPFPSMKRVIGDVLREALGAQPDDRVVDLLVTGYGDPLADRLMRHQTLAWAGAVADRQGWRFHLYGKGWENHPTLSRFARGRLEHDGELALSYQLAGCHLQVTYHMLAHPRLCECVLSGGVPLCRVHWIERSMIETWLFRRAWHEGAAFRDQRHHEDVRRSPWTDAPSLMRFASVFQSMGCFDDAVAPDDAGHCEGYPPGELRGARWGAAFHPHLLKDRGAPAPLGHPFAFEMVGQQPELFFHDQATLEERVRSLNADPELRSLRNSIARRRVLAHHTYRAAADTILSLVRESLASSPIVARNP
ncbi:MAG: glycosyltransferase family 1 protein, partial [Planctomycetes bacterium]|nr:glycosyltransferase family 1 protein [Planctomycetota bacterium]